MPAGSSTTRILYRLNKVCEDLSWLKEHPHYAEVKKSGHFDDMTLCECQLWASIGPEMAAHVWADMSRDDREAIRAAVVEAAENGTSLRWRLGGELVTTLAVRVQDETVTFFLPRPIEQLSGRIPA